jgi:hypothetical protein
MLLMLALTACNKPSQSSEVPSSNGVQKAASKPASGPKAQSACELLTPTEIAGFLRVAAVKKDDLNSGKNEMTKVDFCNWYVKEKSPEGVQLTLRRAESDDEGSRMLVFSSAKGDAVEHDVERDRKAEKLSGVGDEAIYSPYPDGKGGNVAMRMGASAVTITGSASRDDLIAMAKLAAQRM